MSILNVFDPQTTRTVLKRLESLTPQTQPLWGTMDAAKMLAHLNVAYDMAFERLIVKQNLVQKLLMKLVVKNAVTNTKPYTKNLRTAPQFLIASAKDFEKERNAFIQNIIEVEQKGTSYFNGKISQSFGPLTATQWNNMFYKHIDHHFKQFGI
jgi:ribosomal protein L17